MKSKKINSFLKEEALNNEMIKDILGSYYE